LVDQDKVKQPLDRPKEPADFLSAFTQRVKKQVQASLHGQHVNAARTGQKQKAQEEKARQHIAALEEKNADIASGPENKLNRPMRNVVVGQSAMDNFIPGIAGASFTALNTDQYYYYAFFSRLGEQMGNRWVAGLRGYAGRLTNQQLEKLAARDRITVVEVLLTPDGVFVKSILHKSSGDEGLDDVAVQAFREAAPYPNPPHEMVERDGLVHIHYSMVVLARPPFGAG
jgi:protein TonB